MDERADAGDDRAVAGDDRARAGDARAGASQRARLAIGVQVAATVVLFAAAVLLITWLAERPGLRLRFDLPRSRSSRSAPRSRSGRGGSSCS
jgi:hypothetical protein